MREVEARAPFPVILGCFSEFPAPNVSLTIEAMKIAIGLKWGEPRPCATVLYCLVVPETIV